MTSNGNTFTRSANFVHLVCKQLHAPGLDQKMDKSAHLHIRPDKLCRVLIKNMQEGTDQTWRRVQVTHQARRSVQLTWVLVD